MRFTFPRSQHGDQAHLQVSRQIASWSVMFDLPDRLARDTMLREDIGLYVDFDDF